jgi:hypothetical protein
MMVGLVTVCFVLMLMSARQAWKIVTSMQYAPMEWGAFLANAIVAGREMEWRAPT